MQRREEAEKARLLAQGEAMQSWEDDEIARLARGLEDEALAKMLQGAGLIKEVAPTLIEEGLLTLGAPRRPLPIRLCSLMPRRGLH